MDSSALKYNNNLRQIKVEMFKQKKSTNEPSYTLPWGDLQGTINVGERTLWGLRASLVLPSEEEKKEFTISSEQRET